MQKFQTDPHRKLVTAVRTMSVLEILNRCNPARVSDIVRQGTLSRGAVCRILNTLESEGYVARERRQKTYRLTRRVLNLSMGYGADDVVVNSARNVISELSQQTVWPIILTGLRGPDIETLATTEYDNPFAISRSRLGNRIPIVNTASGCVLLAAENKRLRNNYLDLIEQTGVTVEMIAAFKSRVEVARCQKYAAYQEKGAQEACVAVAIVINGRPVAGLAIKYIASAVSYSSMVNDLVPLLFESAIQIESRDE